MSNDAVNDFSVAVSALVQTVGTLAQQSFELLNIGFKAVVDLVEPLVKTGCDLVCKAPVTGTTVVSATPVTPVFQGSSVSAPKK